VDLGDLSSSGDFQDTVITIRNNGDDPLYIAPSLDPQGSQAIQILTPLPLGPILKNDETELVLRYSYSGSGNHDSNLFLPNNDIEAVASPFSFRLHIIKRSHARPILLGWPTAGRRQSLLDSLVRLVENAQE
jgi:hypothetical protein